GKVEAGIPEDDPRNPATIADNVGDNVGDVAGMGADLYESYCGSVLATAALGVAAYPGSLSSQFDGVIAPMLLAAAGIVASVLGILAVSTKEGATQQDLLRSLGRGIHLSSVLTVVFSWGILQALDLPNRWGLWGSIVVGVITGVVIGRATELFTSPAYWSTRRVAEGAKTGPATVIIAGLGTGMESTLVPVVGVVLGTSRRATWAAAARRRTRPR
ncbi:MAG: sodium/proton-translocating pyrophosphatase, partial [Planctomycetes bacterium]|nr:sodium/proton-translocating pyrophosphatase [Planctomycetota bacterium]